MKIAVSGKGGAGKTTVAACLARLYAGHGRSVYAIDADPGGDLGSALDVSSGSLAALRPIFDMSAYLDEQDEDGELYLLNPESAPATDDFSVDAPVPGSVSGSGRIRFLRICDPQAGATCYCREHGFLRALVNSMALGGNDIAILDMSPGVEHLARGTARGVDVMLTVAEPTRASVEFAKTVKAMSAQMGVERVAVVGNKSRGERDDMFLRANFHRDELLGCMRHSEAIAERAMGLASAGSRGAAEAADAELMRIVERINEAR